MQYWKSENENIVISIGTVNADGDGNIQQEEYELLAEMLRAMPSGKAIHNDGNGYSYVDHGVPEEDEPPVDELFAILTGESE